MMGSIRKYLHEYKHLALVSYYFIVQILYYYTEAKVVPRYFMECRLDNYIPFIKYFIVPYLFWFAYMAIGFIYLGIKSKPEFLRLCLYMFSGMTLCYILYMVFPNGQRLRPVITETDVFSRAIQRIYQTDTPTNVAPSIHVYNSLAVHIGLLHYKPFQMNKWARWSSFVCMLLIILSTVFIKQHAILDVFWSFVLAFPLYLVVYKLIPAVKASTTLPHQMKNTIFK
jgi:membrane-associated phospholipid phosphatase